MATTTEQALLAAVKAHFDAEEANDVDLTLSTLTDDVIYEHPYVSHVMHGKDEVQEYYKRRMSVANAYGKIEVRRYWVCGDDVVACETEAGPPDKRIVGLAILRFRDGKLAHELVYSENWSYPEYR